MASFDCKKCAYFVHMYVEIAHFNQNIILKNITIYNPITCLTPQYWNSWQIVCPAILPPPLVYHKKVVSPVKRVADSYNPRDPSQTNSSPLMEHWLLIIRGGKRKAKRIAIWKALVCHLWCKVIMFRFSFWECFQIIKQTYNNSC